MDHRQEYHERDLFPAGLTSPLLDLLNLRYLLVPADAPERADLAPLVAALPTVYTDAHVRILENPEAHRAFIRQLFNYMTKQPVDAYGKETHEKLRASFAASTTGTTLNPT